MKGRVLFFDETYGFIQSPEYPSDVFFHYSSIASNDLFKRVSPGDDVEFELYNDNGKIAANNVRVVNSSGVVKVRVVSLGSRDTDELAENLSQSVKYGLMHYSVIDNFMIMCNEKLSNFQNEEVKSLAENSALINIQFPRNAIFNSYKTDITYKFI